MPDERAINKVVYGGTTLMDITDTTATENSVASGETFYRADGVRSVGTYTPPMDFKYLPDVTGVAGTSTTQVSTIYDVTFADITEYRNGMTVAFTLPVAGVSTYGSVLQINDLGYKPIVRNVNTVLGTTYAAGSTLIAVYNATQTATAYLTKNKSSTITGCWQVADYDSNTNTIGYQLRTNSLSLPMKSVTYRYRLLFTSADQKGWVPANNSTSTNATAVRTVCQDKIDPFGSIVYYGTTAAIAAGSRPSVSYLWQQYVVTLGYSFNSIGADLELTTWTPVYIKCAPQSDGSAIIDSTTPYVQSLPSTADGKIYIFLGIAVTATTVEVTLNHPVYCYSGGMIRLWTNDIGNIPAGGTSGQILVKNSSVDYDAAWVSPATTVEQDNTLPITSAAVYTEVGNINALLATI